MALQHLRSGTANKRPIPTAMSDGQLAVNTNLASPGLFFKDSNGDLVKAGPVHVGTTAPNASPASTAATALVSGTVYQILTIGTSDFTAVGASANTVGVVFTATGTTTGTGTVSGQQGVEKGEQWLDTTNSLYVMKVYDGTGWRVTDSISLANGSAAAPSLHFGSDTNTGLFRSAADSLAITTAGTQRVTVDSSGNVGIGTSSPYSVSATSNSLNIANTSSSAEINFLSSTTGFNSLYFGDGAGGTDRYRGYLEYAHNGDYMRFATGTVERLRIDSSGNVGIGTSSPSDTLHLNGATGYGLKVTDSSSHIGVYRTHSDGAILKTASNHALLFGTNDTERLRIDSSGRVGIGTSSPTTKCVISNGGAEGLEFGHTSGTNEVSSYNRNTSARAPVDIIAQTFEVLTGNPSLNTGYSKTARAKLGLEQRRLIESCMLPVTGFELTMVTA